MVALFILCIFVNVGMWFERFVIIVTSLARAFNPSNWVYYKISFTEVCLIVGSFAWFFMFLPGLHPGAAGLLDRRDQGDAAGAAAEGAGMIGAIQKLLMPPPPKFTG